MEKQEAKSKWDELARVIGAEISPEAEHRVESTPRGTDESGADVGRRADKPSQLSASPVGAAPPKRPEAGWDILATEFGLPQPEAAPLLETKEDVVVVSDQVVVSEVTEVERPRREREPRQRGESPPKRRGPRTARREDRDADDDELRARRQRTRDERGQRGERDLREQRGRRDVREQRGHCGPREEHAATPKPTRAEREDRSEPREPTDRAEPEQRRDDDQPPQTSPAVSLWQKIFGTPAEPQAKPVETTFPVEDSVETVPGAGHERAELEEERDFGRSADVDEALETEERDRDNDEVRPSAEEQQRRPRRRRRGRGGRSERTVEGKTTQRHSRKSAPHEFADVDEFDALADDEDDLAMEIDAEGESAADDGREEPTADQATTGRSRVALQRNIPTWDDAIGFIVDSNMQARSQRRQSSHASSRSSSSRGRTRSRRKR